MPKAINDEFSNLPVSRERKRQLRRIRDGFCLVASCKNHRFGENERCVEHLVGQNKKNRSKNNSIIKYKSKYGFLYKSNK